jgi:hypothetical protein
MRLGLHSLICGLLLCGSFAVEAKAQTFAERILVPEDDDLPGRAGLEPLVLAPAGQLEQDRDEIDLKGEILRISLDELPTNVNPLPPPLPVPRARTRSEGEPYPGRDRPRPWIVEVVYAP